MKLDKLTPLCKLAYKYGTDKCPQIRHLYTLVYYELLKDKKDIKKVLEMGIGCYFTMFKGYKTGASLYMWRDYFPNAHIYGADNMPRTIFARDRITTLLCDETKEEDLKKLINYVGADIDLFIDDGSHKAEHQIFMCKTVMPLLKKDVIYIIEDIINEQAIVDALPEYDCEVIKISSILKKEHLKDNEILIRVKNL